MENDIDDDQASCDIVRRGAAFLDERVGLDWPLKIDLEVFDLAVTDKCVLGQLYGEYSVGVDRLLRRDLDAADYGFWALSSYGWDGLDACWREVIGELQAERGPR